MGVFFTLALILSRKLPIFYEICVTPVVQERYGLQNDSVSHFDYACCISNVRFLLGKLYAKIYTRTK